MEFNEFTDAANEWQAVYGPRERDLLRFPWIHAMRRLFILLVLTLAIWSSGLAQNQPDDAQLLALIKELQTQQAQIADNQAKIESKIADLAETVRLARIYSKREK